MSGLLEETRDVWRFHKIVESQRRVGAARVHRGVLTSFADIIRSEKEALEAALRIMRPRRSALHLLEKFRGLGIPQVALSDFECGYKLQALGLQHYFSNVFSCSDLGYWKPSPIPLNHVQKEMGVRPLEHLHIGDRYDADGLACIRNGCQFRPIS
jgi:FMN phosphatase YigB (HAD superfamily)